MINGIRLYAIAKIAFITARIIASLDFISAVQYMIHFIYHFIVYLQYYDELFCTDIRLE